MHLNLILTAPVQPVLVHDRYHRMVQYKGFNEYRARIWGSKRVYSVRMCDDIIVIPANSLVHLVSFSKQRITRTFEYPVQDKQCWECLTGEVSISTHPYTATCAAFPGNIDNKPSIPIAWSLISWTGYVPLEFNLVTQYTCQVIHRYDHQFQNIGCKHFQLHASLTHPKQLQSNLIEVDKKQKQMPPGGVVTWNLNAFMNNNFF